MSRVILIHPNVTEAEERARYLRRVGHEVEILPIRGPSDLRSVKAQSPHLIIIDLTRQPSHGRAVATVLRQQKATRAIPLVFAGGDRKKVEQLQELLPDAVYADWCSIVSEIREALTSPPEEPVVPGTMAGYSRTPLPRKLGIRAGSSVALLGAPPAFEERLAPRKDCEAVRS